MGQARGVRDLGCETNLAKVRTPANNVIFLEVEARVERASAHEGAFLDPQRMWHAGTAVVAGRRALQADVHAGLGHLLAAGRFAELRQVMQPAEDARWARIGPAFQHRARRRRDAPQSLLQAIRVFARTRPPVDVAHSVLRSFAYAWTTTARFHNPVGSRLFCGAAAFDAQRHHISCVVFRRWL